MRGPVLLIIAALALVSCAKHAPKAAAPVTPVAPKPAAPPPPPAPPLSTPQTRVELPELQKVDPAALVRESTTQDTPPVVKPSVAPRKPRQEPAAAAPTTPPPTATPAEAPQVAIQEVISPTEIKRLQDQVQGRRREVRQILDQLNKRRPIRGQQVIVNDIRNFMALSEEAEKRNDIRQADAFAERAQILARDLQNGK
ncbi:MAG TPA: hypothetical protein VGF49_24120 [Candidatus Solibacter sp.]